jgi:hypothetical protein
MKRIILGLVLLISLCLPAASQFNGCPAGFCPLFQASGGGSPIITDLGNNNAFANSQTISDTVLSNTAASTLVVVCVFDGNTSISGATVTDSKSNTYALITSQAVSGTNTLCFDSFLTTPLVATTDSVTYHTNSGFTSAGMGLTVFSARKAAGGNYTALDAATTNTNNNGFTASYSVTGAGSASVANELYIGYVFTFGGGVGSPPSSWSTNPPSFTAGSGISANNFLVAWKNNSGTSALTFGNTLVGGASNAYSMIFSFK